MLGSVPIAVNIHMALARAEKTEYVANVLLLIGVPARLILLFASIAKEIIVSRINLVQSMYRIPDS